VAPRILDALGDPRIRSGGWLSEQLAQAGRERRLATGVDAVDALLGGGFPRGRLSEVTGPSGSGRTALAFALAAAVTREGEVAAWIDAADALDPASLVAAGVAASRLLWVRAPSSRDALLCTERLLLARGFALVVLDLPDPRAATTAIWLRLARCASAGGAGFVLLGSEPCLGASATLTVDLRALRLRFAERPAWLEGLESRVALVRSRLGPAEGFAPVCWKVPPIARDETGKRSATRGGAA
jgi:hypothetical protein